MNSKSTDWVKNRLLESNSLQDLLNDVSEAFVERSFSDRINEILQASGLTKGMVVEMSGLSTPYVYELFNGHKMPTRDRLIMLCFGMEADLECLQDLLKLCNHSPLYPKHKRDAVIMFCINKQFDLYKTDEMLYEMNEKTLLKS